MIDISAYKKEHGRGPGEFPPTEGGAWTFLVESAKTAGEFKAPPGSTYGDAVRSVKQYVIRMFPGQRNVRIFLQP